MTAAHTVYMYICIYIYSTYFHRNHETCSHTHSGICGVFPGCPGAKKTEFLTSVLDALSTDMVHAVTDPASAGRYGRVDSLLLFSR